MTKLLLTMVLSLFLLNQQGNGQCNITCPGNITITSGAGQCGAIVQYTPPSVPQVCLGTQTKTRAFTFTGDVQTFTVPAGVTSITIKTWGAQGGITSANSLCGETGGLGGYAQGDLAVQAGQVLSVYVGGMPAPAFGSGLFTGGFNGGGTHGKDGGGGGGASDIRTGSGTLTDRIIVAGGGGGGSRFGCSQGGKWRRCIRNCRQYHA